MSARATWPPAFDTVSILELIETAAISLLRGDARMSALVAGRIYTAIPSTAVYPYVLLEGFVVSPFNRLRGFGVDVGFTARAQSQVKGDYEAHRIGDRIVGLFEGRRQDLPPAKVAIWSVNATPGPTFTDVNAGVLTFHRPVDLRVRVQV